MQTRIAEKQSGLQSNGIMSNKAEINGWQAADAYVKAQVGQEFEVGESLLADQDTVRSFYILRHFAGLDNPVIAGQLRMNVQTGEIMPLTSDEIWTVQERALVRAEHKRGHQVARDDAGLILPYQAKIKVNAYLSDQVAFFARAEGKPQLINGKPPFWRVATVLQLRGYGKVADLGTVDVNALTGNVVALTASDIKSRQQRAEHAAITAKHSAEPRG